MSSYTEEKMTATPPSSPRYLQLVDSKNLPIFMHAPHPNAHNLSFYCKPILSTYQPVINTQYQNTSVRFKNEQAEIELNRFKERCLKRSNHVTRIKSMAFQAALICDYETQAKCEYKLMILGLYL